jgi:hypothetical protein
MNPVAVGALVFACVFGGALLGLRLRKLIPDPHLSSDTKDVVKLAMGLVATMTALILGLLIASAKGSYDSQKTSVIQMAAKVAYLDRVLGAYGPEAIEARSRLRGAAKDAAARIWPDKKSQPARLDPSPAAGEALYRSVQKLTPPDDEHRAIKAQALQLVTDLGQMRWLLFEQAGSSISAPLLFVVSAWLTLIFTSFALFAPSNTTVVVSLMIAALSVAGSIFLILELDEPFDGIIRIPKIPFHTGLEQVAQ